MFKGKRSGVNWMREKFAGIEEAIALASVVLPTPEHLSRARASQPDARPSTNPPRYPYPRPPGGRTPAAAHRPPEPQPNSRLDCAAPSLQNTKAASFCALLLLSAPWLKNLNPINQQSRARANQNPKSPATCGLCAAPSKRQARRPRRARFQSGPWLLKEGRSWQ